MKLLQKKKSVFKLKNLVLLLGLGSLTPGYCLTTYSAGSAGTIYANPIYGNVQHLGVMGDSLTNLVADIPAQENGSTHWILNGSLALQSNFINYSFPSPAALNYLPHFNLGESEQSPEVAAINSIYGINFLEITPQAYDNNSQGIYYMIHEQDNFAYYQYNLNPGTTNSDGQLYAVAFKEGTQNANNLVSQPSIKSIQEVEPADSNDDDMPIYHIVVNSGYGVQDSTANSTVASAYYFNAYDSSPFDSSSVGDSVVEPLSVIPDPNDGTDYGLSQADFYYHGDLKNIGIYQNINYFPEQDNYSSSMYSGSDTQSLSKATPPTPPAGASEPTYSEASTFKITIQPSNNATSSMADPIYANGMNQAAFTVTIYMDDGTKKISPTDPTYGWLYGLVYFKDLNTGNIITNLQNSLGSEAITINPGSYTKSNGSLSAVALTNTPSQSNTFYYSSTQTGNHEIEAVLEIPTSDGAPVLISSSPLPPLQPTPLTFQVENNSTLSATSANFPSSGNTSSGSMSFSNNIQSASNGSPATYLNLDNPAHPVYVGFVRYANVSAYNYYATKASPYYAVNLNGANYSINGSGLSFSYSYQALGQQATYPNEMAIDVVDKFGNLYQTAGYGD